MRIQYKLILLVNILFWIAGIAGCILQHTILARSALHAATNKVENIAITVANFGIYDENYITNQRITSIIKATKIDDMSVAFKDDVTNNEEVITANYNCINVVKILSNDKKSIIVEILSTPKKYQEIVDSFWFMLFKWLLIASILGGGVAIFFLKFFNSKVNDIHSLITLNGYESKSSKINIREFEDLKEMSVLLTKLTSHRLLVESKKFLKINSESAYVKLLSDEFYKEEHYKFGKFKLEIQTADSNPEGSFYCKVNDNNFFFAKLANTEHNIKSLLDSILARDLLVELIKTKPLEVAIKELSSICNIEQFTMLTFEGSNVKSTVYKNLTWFTENYTSPKTLLFTTAQMGEGVRFYSNLEVKEEKLLIISKLLPDGQGGIFILIENNNL